MKRDITRNQKRYEAYVRHLETTDEISRHNAQLILAFNKANITGEINHEVTLVRAVNEMQKLKSVCRALKNAPLDALTADIVADYQQRKKTNRIFKHRVKDGVAAETSEPIADSVYGDWNKALKKFYKWLCGPGKIPEHIKRLRTKFAEPAVVYLREQDVDRYIGLVDNFRLKVIVGALYNTGLRPQELFKLQFREMRIEHRDNGLSKVTFSLDYSKTQKRTVSIFQKEKVELFLTYLREYCPDWEQRPDDYIFAYSLDVFRRQLAKTTRRYLGRAYRPKDLRSSHACNFANKVRSNAMDINMGWRIGSQVRQRYISASALTNEDYIEEIEDSVDRRERQQLRQENVRMQDQLKRFQEKLGEFEKATQVLDLVLRDKRGRSIVAEKARELAAQ